MKKDIKNHLLKKQISELEKENSILRKKTNEDRIEVSTIGKMHVFLHENYEESNSCQIMHETWNNKTFILIYKNSIDKSLTIKEKCEALFVAKGSYYRWIERNKDIIKNELFPIVKKKYSVNAIDHIKNFVKLFRLAGSKIISKWIFDNTQDRVSSKIINELKRSNKFKMKYVNRSKKKYTKHVVMSVKI